MDRMGQYGYHDRGRGLAANSPWRTDLPAYSAVINYNLAAGKPVEIITGNSFAPAANLVNVTDSLACGGPAASPAASAGY